MAQVSDLRLTCQSAETNKDFQENQLFPVKVIPLPLVKSIFKFLNQEVFEKTIAVSKKWQLITKNLHKTIPKIEKLRALFRAIAKSELVGLPGFHGWGEKRISALCIDGERLIFESKETYHFALHSSAFYKKEEVPSNLLKRVVLPVKEKLMLVHQDRHMTVHFVSNRIAGSDVYTSRRDRQCELVIHQSNASRIVNVPTDNYDVQCFVPITKDTGLISHDNGEVSIWDISGDIAKRMHHISKNPNFSNYPGKHYDKWYQWKNHLIQICDNDDLRFLMNRKRTLQVFNNQLQPISQKKCLNELIRGINTPFVVEYNSNESNLPTLNCYAMEEDGSFNKSWEIDTSKYFSYFDNFFSILVKNWLVLKGRNEKGEFFLVVFDLNEKKAIDQIIFSTYYTQEFFPWNLNEDILIAKNVLIYMNEGTKKFIGNIALHLPTKERFVIDGSASKFELMDAKITDNSLVFLLRNSLGHVYAAMGRLGMPPDPEPVPEPLLHIPIEIPEPMGLCIIC